MMAIRRQTFCFGWLYEPLLYWWQLHGERFPGQGFWKLSLPKITEVFPLVPGRVKGRRSLGANLNSKFKNGANGLLMWSLRVQVLNWDRFRGALFEAKCYAEQRLRISPRHHTNQRNILQPKGTPLIGVALPGVSF